MASVIDICNLALAHLGDEATVSSISPPEGSAQAELCARFYPIARDTLLEEAEPLFARTRTTLAALGSTVGQWAYAYARPADALKVLRLYEPGADDSSTPPDYQIETLADGSVVILTDTAAASVRYVRRATDPTKFSTLFVDALSWWLAAYLAGPILKGDAGRAAAKDLRAYALALAGRAGAADANQQRMAPEHTPDWISGR